MNLIKNGKIIATPEETGVGKIMDKDNVIYVYLKSDDLDNLNINDEVSFMWEKLENKNRAFFIKKINTHSNKNNEINIDD